MSEEIMINVLNLHSLEKNLERLSEKGTGKKIYCTSKFINYSKGETADSFNELYAELAKIEDLIVDSMKTTVDEMKMVITDFAKVDYANSVRFNSIIPKK